MNSNDTTKNNQRALANVAMSLTLVLGMLVSNMPAAGAQGMGPDQESLLPPEVVPLDPQVANKMTQSQAATRAIGNNFDTQSAPGLVQGGGNNTSVPAGLPLSTGQTPQEFRQAAFNSLMGQPVAQAAPQVNPNLQSMQGQMGQAPGMNSSMNGQVGQSAWVTPGTTPGLSNQASGGMQSQTLSGGVRNPEIGRPSKLSKLSHGVGLATMLGSGVMMGAVMSRNPASLYSTGLFGLGVASYGLRNGFSRF
jgi:hypothetical protein